MNQVEILDCTLRDGGYCNQWKFGHKNMQKVTQGLLDANVDIVECGFLTDKEMWGPDVSKFNSIEETTEIIPKDRKGKIFVVMMNYGEYDVDRLPEHDIRFVDGIRVAFHKKDKEAALVVCGKIKEKGYKVFVQAMVSLCYSDEEFLELIREVNKIDVYAFYIVDSFGMMKKRSLMRLFYMVENNLNPQIWIGFHSHNNMQLAYSNAQSLVDSMSNRNLIIDTSICGMGRGAGNLNTELFVEYLNENFRGDYVLKPLLNVIDEIISPFYQKNYWGYSLPNYLSAAHGVHPNYAAHLSEKNTLTVEAMDEILSMISEKKKNEYDKNHIEDLYVRYMDMDSVQEAHYNELHARLNGRTLLLIAPGKSSEEEKEKIVLFSKQDNVVTVSVNFDYPEIVTDYIFLSNLRRFRELEESKYEKCIVTNNIVADSVYLQTKYFDLLNPIEVVKDNAGLMAINFFVQLNVKEIYLAGFDGYSHNVDENYAFPQMTIITRNAIADAMNRGLSEMIVELRKKIPISFLTKSKYIHI